MSRVTIEYFASADDLAEIVARFWVNKIQRASTNGRKPAFALSGGRIARKLYEQTARIALEQQARVDDLLFFWADERCVPPNDRESNFRVASELLFSPLQIPVEHIHRIRGEDDPATAATQASEALRQLVPSGPHRLPQLDLVFLGMGEDGHVASIFPQALKRKKRAKEIYYPVTGPKPPPNRVTLSMQMLVEAKEVWVLVSGPGKEKALRNSLPPKRETPLGVLLQTRRRARVFAEIQ